MMLNKIDELIIRSGLKHKRGTEGQRRSNPADQAWKSAAFKSWASEDDWEFGKWGNESKSATGSWGEGGRRPRSSERWEHNNRRSGDDRPPSEFGKWGNESKSSWEQGDRRPWSSEVGGTTPDDLVRIARLGKCKTTTRSWGTGSRRPWSSEGGEHDNRRPGEDRWLNHHTLGF